MRHLVKGKFEKVDSGSVVKIIKPFRAKTFGFTLIELLVVIAIIALLISILMPSLQKAKELAKQVVCQTQLKNIGTGLWMYADDNDERFPMYWYNDPGGDIQKQSWLNPLRAYMGLEGETTSYGSDIYKIYVCPSITDIYQDWTTRELVSGRTQWYYELAQPLFSIGPNPPPGCSYTTPLVPRFSDYGKFADQLIVMWCGGSSSVASTYDYLPSVYPDYLHQDGGNILFADTHVEFASYDDVANKTEQVERETNKILDTVGEDKYLFYQGY
jgi:prepilin-type N-terminal cleavage/methylation domain-containing protein/prepilin-type processing-associated H-X9-DG protein